MMQKQHSQSVGDDDEKDGKIARTQSQATFYPDDGLYQTIVEHKLIKDVIITKTYKEVDKVSIHKKHYVNYTLLIKTDYCEYTIDKRYSEFLKLHDSISHIIPYLPKFPEKKLFHSNSKKTIAERQELLQCIFILVVVEFLNIVLKHLNNRLHQFLVFINIKDQFGKVGLGKNLRIHELSKDEASLNDLKNLTHHQKYLATNDPEKMIMHYINKLNNRYDERSKIFSKMEKYFFGKMHMISSSFLKLLFIGDDEMELMGIVQLLKINSSNHQAHISCVTGLQFLRKVLEFDYNPYAENAIRVFGELTLKQIKTLKIETHINGNINKMCKQDALRILFKYVNQNQLKMEFLKFLIEDQSTIDEYLQFAEQYKQQNKKEDYQFQMVNELDISQSTNLPTKSTSKEYAQLLDLEPSIEQLEDIYKKQLAFKIIQEHKGHTISHIQGQFVKTTHLFDSIEQALDLMTVKKCQWLFYMDKSDIIQKIDSNNLIVSETHIWSVKQKYMRVVFINRIVIEENGDYIMLKISPQENYEIYMKEFKNYEYAQKYSIFVIQKQKVENKILVTTIQNLQDKNYKSAYTPILLKENDIFEQSIEKLLSLL